jgi:ligand-binding SRPBCC domain-containing protein
LPLSGPFEEVWETTEASKVIASVTVPASEATVTVSGAEVTTTANVLHMVEVYDVHRDVWQNAFAIRKEAVSSLTPKFKPRTVTELVPE